MQYVTYKYTYILTDEGINLIKKKKDPGRMNILLPCA